MFACTRNQVIRITHFARNTYRLRNLSVATIKLRNIYGVNQNNTTAHKKTLSSITLRRYSDASSEFTESKFLNVCEDTLYSLYECFEEIVDKHLSHIKDVDIMYEGGILKVDLGPHGTYVINRQTPNKQIWLSSPISGPKRYDFVNVNDVKGYWVYKHDGVTLHKLLEEEISSILTNKVDLSKCLYCKL